MTDLEISTALAKAIGWKSQNVLPSEASPNLLQCWLWTGHNWSVFDYHDWNVIGPIAERYKCFPGVDRVGNWSSDMWQTEADNPQKAIALAVIGCAK